MTRCSRWFPPKHSALTTKCDLCRNVAVFHWRETYPDLLLCRDDLDNFPEAEGPPLESLKIELDWYDRRSQIPS